MSEFIERHYRERVISIAPKITELLAVHGALEGDVSLKNDGLDEYGQTIHDQARRTLEYTAGLLRDQTIKLSLPVHRHPVKAVDLRISQSWRDYGHAETYRIGRNSNSMRSFTAYRLLRSSLKRLRATSRRANEQTGI